ncbi:MULTISPECIES: hypothetical protein [Gordonia]|uniref:Uncharacterized protein n=1 Tax=Gordonia sihwensis NBRC 108236 TaxID=1223544 RepID=L7LIE4_9ACTN|nr:MULTISPECIES: hypothetical protein [Gordonia]AUH68897.1 hypothetical protein CXX93_11700 [Gordonia sp. YC-JH1]GAC59838.1 hypothetical protein GSI01S_05_01590 [Gordonia sihwensis NBRC 108236]
MTAHSADPQTTAPLSGHATVTRLPTSYPLVDPELDVCLDPDLFQQGFDESLAYLSSLPPTWARHHAASVLENGTDPDDDLSYQRGYRAGLYGFLRHGTT